MVLCGASCILFMWQIPPKSCYEPKQTDQKWSPGVPALDSWFITEVQCGCHEEFLQKKAMQCLLPISGKRGF